MNKTISILRAPVLQACCRRGARIQRTAMLLLATLLLTMTAQTAWADTWPEYITDVVLAGGSESEAASVKNSSTYSGYTWCSTSLNDGTNGDVIYIGYKKGSRANVNGGYITHFIIIDAGTGTEGHNPPYSLTFQGRTYYRCPAAGGDYFVNSNHGNLTSQAANGWNMYLYYTKANFSDKRAVDGISIYSVGDINEHKSGAINCYYKDGTLHEAEISLNKGVSKTPYVYMHINTVTKTNRPSADPVMASGLVYNGSAKQLIATGATLASGTMYYRLGTSGSFTSTMADVKATTAGTHTVYYNAGANSYSNQSDTHSATVSIAKSPNSGVTVSCDDVLEGVAPSPTTGGTNLSTGAITYQYSTAQNGTYSATVPTTAGTYWVKATVAADDNCTAYPPPAVSFQLKPDWAVQHSGTTEADAYVISTTEDLNLLASRVNAGNNYSGKFFRLGANITYDGTENNFTPIGVYGAPFAGTFDGNGMTISGLNINKPNNNNVGLFGRANNATIKNLKLDNCTITGKESTGAIVGLGGDNVTITNCRVTNSVTVSGTSYVGGIVGQNANVIGCASAATLSGSSNYVGGIIGNSNSNTIANSLYTGTSVSCSGNNKGAIVGSNTNTTLTVNYYTADLTIGGVNGSDTNGARRAVAINTADGVTVTPTGTAITYNVSGITTYADNQGMIYSDTFYAGATETVSLDIAYDIEGFSLTGYTDGNGNTLTHVSGNTYTLTMPATTVSITPEGQDLWGESTDGRDGSTAAKAFRITTPAGLDLLAKKVTGTDGYTANNYSGKYFELGADIDYSEVALTLDGGKSNYAAIGYYNSVDDKRVFSGHFDGLGHKISGIVMDKTANNQGIFACIEGAEVKNLTVTNVTITIGGDNYNVGGIAGKNANTSVIENCHVTASVTVTAKTGGSYGLYAGGIVGQNSAYVRGCTSAATVSAKRNAGAIAGSHGYGTIENCLVLGANVTANANDAYAGAIVGYLNDAALANNRYTGATTVNGITGSGHGTGNNADIDGQATVAYQFPADIDNPGIMGTEGTTYGIGTYQGITAYENGLAYQGHLYYPSLWTGSGDSDSDPYVIYTTEGLDKLANDVNSGSKYKNTYFALGHDITYDKTALTIDFNNDGTNDSNFRSIGDDAIHQYYGAFDGKGHTISGLVINKTNSEYYVGLFGYYCSENSEYVRNLTVANSAITGQNSVGAIVGSADNGVTIENCVVASDVTVTGTENVGGIVGYLGKVLGCTSAATVSGKSYVGGIMGYNSRGTTKDCLYLGTSVSGTGSYVGAIIGHSVNTTVTNNYYTAYGLGGVNGSDTDGARFAVSSTTKPDAITGDATATYGTGTYTGITAYGTNGLEYDGKYYWHDENLMELADRNEGNSSIIANNDGQTRNVVLKDRTLYKDGSWNTLCLPFAVDLTASGTLSGDNVQAMTLDTTTSNFADGTLTDDEISAIAG